MDFYGLTAQMSFLGFYLPGDRMKLHQSGDKIIVTELRPMSDLPNRVEVFMFLVRGDGFEYFDITSLDCLYHESADVIGWVPKPIYQPEKIIT